MDNALKTRSLIDRLARLNAAATWAHDLNPSQTAALSYLSRANRFSRAPSHVADYLASTRGTVSQTLKALTRKGLVREVRSEKDRRSIRYDVTDEGMALAESHQDFDKAVRTLAETRLETLNDTLSDILRALLKGRDLRSFGICRTCAHHEPAENGGFCRLLNVNLQPSDIEKICHEHMN